MLTNELSDSYSTPHSLLSKKTVLKATLMLLKMICRSSCLCSKVKTVSERRSICLRTVDVDEQGPGERITIIYLSCGWITNSAGLLTKQ